MNGTIQEPRICPRLNRLGGMSELMARAGGFNPEAEIRFRGQLASLSQQMQGENQLAIIVLVQES
jgi:hypothetical protein